MERGVAEADVEGGGGAAGDEAGEVEEWCEERFWGVVGIVVVFIVWRECGWSQRWEDEEDETGEQELYNHVQAGGEEGEVEVEVVRRDVVLQDEVAL